MSEWLCATRDEPLERMDAFFEARLADYEAHMEPWRAHYSWMAQLLPDGICELLDVGCGTGLELDRIFERFPNLHATCIDLSADMLERLAAKHAGRALTLMRADYFKCELGCARFDAAVAFETLHHFEAPLKRELFRRIYDSLKPGGVYLECDYIAQTQAIEELTFAECARRRTRDGISRDAYVHFDTPLTLEHEMNALREGGFERVELVGFLPGDRNTPMLRAVKRGA